MITVLCFEGTLDLAQISFGEVSHFFVVTAARTLRCEGYGGLFHDGYRANRKRLAEQIP
jgi:hypothetical protein